MRIWMTGLTCLAVVLVLAGCVKREEKITVFEDGSLHWQIEVTGDETDMMNDRHGVPVMTERDGWSFSQRTAKSEGQETKRIRSAEKRFASVVEMPSTYPTNDTKGAELALRHPTSLTMEKTADGTYFHFRRVYEPRKSAYVNYWYEKLIEEYDDKDEDDMNRAEKMKFVSGLVDVERRKQVALIQWTESLFPEKLPQLVRLAMRDAVAKVYSQVDRGNIQSLLDAMGDDDKKREDATEKAAADQLEALARRVEGEVAEAIEQSLRSNVSDAQVRMFTESLDRERRRFEITEDYEDEIWEITLTLPGKLIGHNATKTQDGNVVWEMKAGEFQDRQVELLASSFVENK